MGTWAVQTAWITPARWSKALADQSKASGTRITDRVSVVVNQMLGDDDDDSAAAGQPQPDDDSYPYYLAKDRLALDLAQSDEEEGDEEEGDEAERDEEQGDEEDPLTAEAEPDQPASDVGEHNGAQKQRHTPRHAAPQATFAAKLSSARPKLPGFAPKSSHAAW